MQVSFVCQRCCQPLKLDTSFNVLDRVTIQELIGMCGFVDLSSVLWNIRNYKDAETAAYTVYSVLTHFMSLCLSSIGHGDPQQAG